MIGQQSLAIASPYTNPVASRRDAIAERRRACAEQRRKIVQRLCAIPDQLHRVTVSAISEVYQCSPDLARRSLGEARKQCGIEP